ncbi:MAG: hypothetical protein K2N71_13035, partial [Oscillospiraceae bacterium]|nr:hypothetical protein [Oscillospiraceae bacterium]
ADEGKSEEEICLSLGEPKSAAASLLNEQTGGERISKLAEIWLPLIISAGLFAIYIYFGFKVDLDTFDHALPIMYVLPMIMWVLFERKSFFTALSEYKCDFFTFFGSLCMIAAGLACDELPKRTFLKNPRIADTNMQTYAVLTAVFISAAIILLAVSLWKNAPKIFSAVTLVGIIFIVYNCVTLVQAYHIWSGNPDELFGITAAGQIGESFFNILIIIFICASAFLLWSFISRNALTLASAYSAITVTGFMFYWYNTLATLDPTYEGSIAYLRNMCSGRNYIVWGAAIAAAVLIMTIIVKLAGRKKVG